MMRNEVLLLFLAKNNLKQSINRYSLGSFSKVTFHSKDPLSCRYYWRSGNDRWFFGSANTRIYRYHRRCGSRRFRSMINVGIVV